MTNDGQNQYAYDAEGRVCAVQNLIGGLYGYLYNAEGVRVAKGTIQLVNGNLSCDTTQNGFQVTASYILDQNNQQLTEMSWSGGTAQWAHTNVWAAGAPIATYSVNPNPSDNQPGILNFLLTDWLGTRRVLTDSAGNPDEVCHSLPYGDGEDCAPTPTEHLFTGKERDAETLNDYFGARYFASTMGRFLSPDWSAAPMGVPYADMSDPQSLNLYGYVRDNPLSQTDPNGHRCLFTPVEMTCGPSPTTPDAFPASPQEADDGNPMSQEQSGDQQQGLSSKSGQAIDKASKKYGYDASAFKAAMTQAGSKYKLNPNLLVGLGMRESSLNPSQSNGGLFQIQDPKAYGIDPKDIGNFEVQIPAAAAFLSGNISHFNGNVDLGVAAWTLGRGGTSHFFNEGGMPAVRGALLSAKHPDYGTVGGYIDFITSF